MGVFLNADSPRRARKIERNCVVSAANGLASAWGDRGADRTPDGLFVREGASVAPARADA